jgi:hypothetical protein
MTGKIPAILLTISLSASVDKLHRRAFFLRSIDSLLINDQPTIFQISGDGFLRHHFVEQPILPFHIKDDC